MQPSTRRKFIQTSAAASASLPLFSIGQSAPGANSKLNMAVIGVAGMGSYATSASASENLVAMCDVDEKRAGREYKKHPNVPKFKDFRVMMDKMHKDIDAVCISTPDHTHFAAAMDAMERGKHVFVQKPLAHNIWQLRTLQKAAKRYKVITQMGNQGHTFEGMRRMKEWIDADMVGEVKEVVTWTDRPNPPWFVPPKQYPVLEQPIPGHLDWDLWQGPVPARPYNDTYVPVSWRGWWDYGCGGLGDIGCHTLDGPFWALGLGSPTKVEVDRKEPPNPEFIPMNSKVTYHFPARDGKPPVKLTWYENGYDAPKPERWDQSKPLPKQGGMYMEGSKNTLFHSGMRPNSVQLTPNERFNEMKPELKKIKRLPKSVGGPIEEFIAAIKGQLEEPGSHFDYAVPLTEVVLLGAMAQRTGHTIEWDADKMEVKGHPELASLIKEPTREGWSYGENLW